MQKLKALTDHLRAPAKLKKAGLKCNPEKIDSWAENGTPEYLGDTGADGGLTLFDHKYKAVIELEEVAGDILLLIASIVCWLEENDPDRDKLDDEKIQWNGVPFDDNTSDIRIELWFYEKTYFGVAPPESEAPGIEYKGTNYELADEEIDTAENDQSLPPIDVDLDLD